MSDVWRFCPISKPAMEQCVANAGTRIERNKWLEEFEKKHTDDDFGKNLYRLIKETGDALDQKETETFEEEMLEQAQAKPASVLYEDPLKEPENGRACNGCGRGVMKEPENGRACHRCNGCRTGERNREAEAEKISFDKEMDRLVELIENEPILNFELMLTEGTRYNVLYHILAERLSELTVYKICCHLFDAEIRDPFHVPDFYTYFFPLYFQRPYSSLSLDLLVKARTAYPTEFHTLLNTLLQDIEVSNKMMYDFVVLMDPNGKLGFLIVALQLELNTPQFLHNITAINEAYEGSEKSQITQMYVYKSLLKHSMQCKTNKEYGKLMLAYIQAVDSLKGQWDLIYLDCLIKVHRSQYSRPCNLLFMDMIKRRATEEKNPTMEWVEY